MRSRINSILFWAFLFAIALAPLPYGLVEPIYQAVWAAWLGCILLASQIWKSDNNFSAGQLAFVVLVAAIFAFLFACQTGWLPSTVRTAILPNSAAPWLSSGLALTHAGNVILSLLTAALCFSLAARPGRSEMIALAIACSAVATGAIGILQSFFAPDQILWSERPGYIGLVIGTFVNRNSSAAFFGMGLIVCTLYFARAFVRSMENRVNWPVGDKSFWLGICGASLLAVCLIKTGSRAGFLFSVVGLVFSCALYGLAHRRLVHQRAWQFAAGSFVVLATIVAIGSELSERISELSFTDTSRSQVAKVAWSLAGNSIWAGSGPGSFPWLFARERPDTMPITSIWDHAHNSYLEIAVAYGVPMAVLLLVIFAAAFAILVYRGVFGNANRLVPLSAAGSMLAAALHALVDFPLLVPGYSMPLMALVAAALAGRRGQFPASDPGIAIASAATAKETRISFAPKHKQEERKD